MKQIKISAIIACYKDELAIPIMYERLVKTFKKLRVQYEIIFVNDGSPDNSEKIIDELTKKDTHVIGIHHTRNFSSQMAFISGMSASTGDAVALLDGDLQDPPEIIGKFYLKWKEGYEVVYGIRTKREASILMQYMYKFFYRLFHSMSYISIPVDAGDFSLIDKKVVKTLLQFSERDVFLRGLRAWVGYKQIGIPYTRPERLFGKTTNSLIKNFHWAIKGIFSFSYVPLQLMTLLSLLAFFIALIGMSIQIILRLILPKPPEGVTTVLVIVLFLGAIQLLGISIIGEYIGKIFEETKQRPKYLVKKITKKQHNAKEKT